jgi:hypothetical protein
MFIEAPNGPHIRPVAGQLNVSGMQTNGTRHSGLYTTSVGRQELVIRGTTWLQTGILVRESNNYSLSGYIRLLR